MLLNASVSRDGEAARQHAKRFVSHIVSGWPDEVLRAKGIDPRAIHAVRQAYAENRGVDYAASLTPDEAVDRLIIAGTAAQCTERIESYSRWRRVMNLPRSRLAFRSVPIFPK